MNHKYLYLLLLFLIVSCQRNVETGPPVLKEMCQRLFPRHAQSFLLSYWQILLIQTVLYWNRVKEKYGIKGNNRNSLAAGLNHYLKNYCHTHVSLVCLRDSGNAWCTTGDTSASIYPFQCDNSFFLNYCTFGYTMPIGNGRTGNDW